MRYGYFMMPMHPPGSDIGVTLQTDLAQIDRLDGLDLLEAVGHELVHLERHHRGWRQDEGLVAAEARMLLAAYLEGR